MNGTVVKVYSRRMDGEKKLSTNFRVREFACKDGSDVILVSDVLVNILQAIRNHFGQPVHITSGYRTVTHNMAVAGEVYSQHLYGMAADIIVEGVSASDVANYAELIMPSSGGIGRYVDFTHIDVRREKSRFTG